jgi:hypothetical protein
MRRRRSGHCTTVSSVRRAGNEGDASSAVPRMMMMMMMMMTMPDAPVKAPCKNPYLCLGGLRGAYLERLPISVPSQVCDPRLGLCLARLLAGMVYCLTLCTFYHGGDFWDGALSPGWYPMGC